MFTLIVHFMAAGLIHSSALAEEPGKNFEARKAEAVKEIDERIGKMQEHRTCVNGAANMDALKACHKNMQEFRHDQKVERMEKRLEKMKEKDKDHSGH